MNIKNAMETLACVVVLYDPTDNVQENINSYINELDMLFLVDNSTKSNKELFKDIIKNEKVVYIHQRENKGIAYALNVGCTEAIKLSYDWILTMDQDSRFIDFTKKTISYFFNALSGDTALLFPEYLINGEIYDKLFKYNGKSFITMTSGNIINLSAYKKVGGFNEDLFIDYVDIDYCLKLAEAGYTIKKVNGIMLLHGLGKAMHKSLFGKKIIITNHNYIRRYYITRNRFFVINRYKKQFPMFTNKESKLFFNDLFKILLFETDRIKKIQSIFKGYIDYKRDQYGERKF